MTKSQIAQNLRLFKAINLAQSDTEKIRTLAVQCLNYASTPDPGIDHVTDQLETIVSLCNRILEYVDDI